MDLASRQCHGIIGILDHAKPFCRWILWILDPVFWPRHMSAQDNNGQWRRVGGGGGGGGGVPITSVVLKYPSSVLFSCAEMI